MTRMIGVLCAAMLAASPLLAGDTPATTTDTTATASTSPVVATFAGGVITEAELDAYAHSRLAPLLQQEYDVKSAALRDIVYERMLEAKAKELGITRDQLYAQQVTDKAAEPDEKEVTATITRYRAQLSKDDAEAHKQVVQVLKQREVNKLEAAFKDQLVAEAGLQVKLDPPRIAVPLTADDPSEGPADAPVTIVEFADYQCPFCERAQATVKKVREVYGDQVRLVVKQMPLPMHAQAKGAAEAALCAEQQGKFWKMHDWLFANRDKLAPAQLKANAQGIGLDPDAFASCMDGQKTEQAVATDLAAAQKVGASATPTFFVNGRLVRGAQPFDTFAGIINDELARKGLPVPRADSAEQAPTSG